MRLILCALLALAAPVATAGIVYEYSDDGQLIGADYGLSDSVVYGYDDSGNLTSVSHESSLASVNRRNERQYTWVRLSSPIAFSLTRDSLLASTVSQLN